MTHTLTFKMLYILKILNENNTTYLLWQNNFITKMKKMEIMIKYFYLDKFTRRSKQT